ncbi:GntR family transcriptional regulator [Microbacterium sp. No. 7]|uniref:GntR family transcriptional regulator n=1 Tax=Microbacterium sp. No. 7 TaxID=1714373 RepID=UPI0006CF7915|nr:GntR family transcriptional regulator [Microbacterium sp. No. 7]ALJ21931.1 hypothetical protein AOA12_19325 [Microbacterium sp. No. 7]
MASDTDSVPDRPAERAERAHRALRAAIIEGALEPDTRLGEEALATHFGVSRTLIRTVLARLVDDGLVDTGKGKSARVAHPTLDEAREAFAVRAALELGAIRALAAAWTPDADDALRAHVRAERQALEARNAKASARLGGEFHIALARATGNALLLRYVTAVVSRTALILTVYGRDIDQAASIDEHEQLIGLLAEGRVDDALALAERHLLTVEDDTLRRSSRRTNRDLASILTDFADLPDL